MFFTKEEFSKLIKNVKEDDMKDLYIFTLNTGLRLDKMRYLKKDNKRIIFPHNLIKVAELNVSA